MEPNIQTRQGIRVNSMGKYEQFCFFFENLLLVEDIIKRIDY